jgi:hypothetical protein
LPRSPSIVIQSLPEIVVLASWARSVAASTAAASNDAGLPHLPRDQRRMGGAGAN